MTGHLAMPTILRGDARNLPLPDESVDLVVTSPPYFGLRSYTDGGTHYDGQLGSEPTPQDFIAALIECTREMMRVLKPSGSIFVNLGDKYSGAQAQNFGGKSKAGESARVWTQTDPKRTGIPNKSLMLLPERYRIAAVDQLGLIARAVIVWAKPNGLPESVTDRVRRSHEDWVHLTKSRRYFAAVDEIREQYAPGTAARYASGYNPANEAYAVGGPTKNGVARHDGGGPKGVNPLGKLPGSVWEIPTQPLKVPAGLGVDHFAAFPMEWPRRLILGWSSPGGVVLDPFGGTGTTALVATMLGRQGISVDLSADYCRLAQWRAADPKERARAAGLDPDAVAAIRPEIPGQTDLFAVLDGEAS